MLDGEINCLRGIPPIQAFLTEQSFSSELQLMVHFIFDFNLDSEKA